jgi:hypothetical protein
VWVLFGGVTVALTGSGVYLSLARALARRPRRAA